MKLIINEIASKVKSVNVNELNPRLNSINLIDIRQPNEYINGHLPGAKNIPLEEILNKPERYLDKEKEYHIICQSGNKSLTACNELMKKGYKVVNVAEGTDGYMGALENKI